MRYCFVVRFCNLRHELNAWPLKPVQVTRRKKEKEPIYSIVHEVKMFMICYKNDRMPTGRMFKLILNWIDVLSVDRCIHSSGHLAI